MELIQESYTDNFKEQATIFVFRFANIFKKISKMFQIFLLLSVFGVQTLFLNFLNY